MRGRNITILEESDRLGGSLDASGSAQDGYLMRGGRMFESKYLCTYDLFSSIPTLDKSKTVTREIFDWNDTIKTSSKSRLFLDGHNVPGEGGLITFPQSNWLASIVLPHQPHFIGQPSDVNVFWGYGLFVDRPGDFV